MSLELEPDAPEGLELELPGDVLLLPLEDVSLEELGLELEPLELGVEDELGLELEPLELGVEDELELGLELEDPEPDIDPDGEEDDEPDGELDEVPEAPFEDEPLLLPPRSQP